MLSRSHESVAPIDSYATEHQAEPADDAETEEKAE